MILRRKAPATGLSATVDEIAECVRQQKTASE